MLLPSAFEWDDAKAASNPAKHGVTFGFATRVFLDFDASHVADGEMRRKAVGLVEGRIYTVVHARRGAGIRVISARRANAREARFHGRV